MPKFRKNSLHKTPFKTERKKKVGKTPPFPFFRNFSLVVIYPLKIFYILEFFLSLGFLSHTPGKSKIRKNFFLKTFLKKFFLKRKIENRGNFNGASTALWKGGGDEIEKK